MSGNQSRSTVEIAKFKIDKTEKVPIKNDGDRCSVKETNLNCDAVLTLLDKKKSQNDKTLFSLSINNYEERIDDNMKISLEKYENVIYYNSQLKKFYSSYSDDDKKNVKQKISHILILGKTETLFINSEGIYTFTIDKTILIYEASHANITSAKESTPALTMYEYFNLIYIDWFSLLLSDFENEFKKKYSVTQQQALLPSEADSEAEAEAEAEIDLKVGVGEEGVGGEEDGVGGEEEGVGGEEDGVGGEEDGVGGEEDGVGGEEEGEIKKEEGEIKKGEGGAEEGDPQSQLDTNAALKIQNAFRAKKAIGQAKKVVNKKKALKRYSDEEEERKEAIITQKLRNRGNIIMENERGASSIGGKKKGKKTKKVKLI